MGRTMRRPKLWLCLPPLAMALLDLGLTLWGQPAPYWEGDFRATREGNPLVEAALRVHPLAVVAAAVAYILFFTGLIVLLPRFAAVSVALAIAQAHAFGAGTWVLGFLPAPFVLLPLLFLASAVLSVLAIELSRTDPRVHEREHPSSRPA
jgi:hypothetical protein